MHGSNTKRQRSNTRRYAQKPHNRFITQLKHAKQLRLTFSLGSHAEAPNAEVTKQMRSSDSQRCVH
eukprot:6206311-Pleurochrysis_carterae.AAC.1